MLSSWIKAEVLCKELEKVKKQNPDQQYKLKEGMEYESLTDNRVIAGLPRGKKKDTNCVLKDFFLNLIGT